MLPKLKCFEIGLSQFCRISLSGNEKGHVPELYLRFVELGPGHINYSRQFPALEKLVVSKLDKCEIRRLPGDEIGEEKWFEMCAGFLSKYLLKGKCLTLRDLEIPLPLGKRMGFKLFKKMGCPRNSDISEMVDCSEFFEKIINTFPNLRWGTFEGVDSPGLGADRV